MNILLLTSVYPSPDDKNENVTKVVQYFAHAWSEQGHCVKVIHNVHKYPSLIHMIPRNIKKKLATKLDFYIPDLKNVSRSFFVDGDVQVFRFPILKIIPHGNHSERLIKRQARRICNVLEKESFIPDIIMGHWMSPQIQIISNLKKIFNCKTSLVLHGRGYISGKRFDCLPYMSSIDKLGCRSRAESEYVQASLNLNETPFVCYSGVPDSFLDEQSLDDQKFISKPDIWKFVFVGRLVAYKQIDKVLIALSKLSIKNFQFDILGEGPEEGNLRELAKKLNIDDKVVFHGRVNRDSVLTYMRESHVFVMISENEVFGLVYLEAMASSCITIGSKNGGIDGVIEDGKNGLLCSAGDADSLKKILDKLVYMDISEINLLSQNGYETAKAFTDTKVAERYLMDATGLS